MRLIKRRHSFCFILLICLCHVFLLLMERDADFLCGKLIGVDLRAENGLVFSKNLRSLSRCFIIVMTLDLSTRSVCVH